MSDPHAPGPAAGAEPGEAAGEGPVQTNLSLEPPAAGGPRLPAWARVAAILVGIAALGGAAIAYRSHHRAKVLREGIARADQLLRADTPTGYRGAADLLRPLTELDPVQAGARRGFALAMLAADYRDAAAAAEADAQLLAPDRAEQVPEHAHLAHAALALGRQEAGTAATYAARAQGPMGLVLRARTSLLAGNLGAAAEPLAAAVAADPSLPAALALRGDVQRRSAQGADARASYEAALAASPGHPRATYGLAKLALSGQAEPALAAAALGRVLDDASAPPPERARAALHLASLQARAGDRAAVAATLDRAGLEPGPRAWVERAVAEQELNRGVYRVAAATPPSLLSASDDDPYVAPPPPPPPPPEPVKHAKKSKAQAKKKAGKAPSSKAKKPASGSKGGKPKAKSSGAKSSKSSKGAAKGSKPPPSP